MRDDKITTFLQMTEIIIKKTFCGDDSTIVNQQLAEPGQMVLLQLKLLAVCLHMLVQLLLLLSY